MTSENPDSISNYSHPGSLVSTYNQHNVETAKSLDLVWIIICKHDKGKKNRTECNENQLPIVFEETSDIFTPSVSLRTVKKLQMEKTAKKIPFSLTAIWDSRRQLSQHPCCLQKPFSDQKRFTAKLSDFLEESRTENETKIQPIAVNLKLPACD